MRVQLLIDGEPQGEEVNLMVGDELSFVNNGVNLDGIFIEPAAARINGLQQRVLAGTRQIDELSRLVSLMTTARSLYEVLGMATSKQHLWNREL